MEKVWGNTVFHIIFNIFSIIIVNPHIISYNEENVWRKADYMVFNSSTTIKDAAVYYHDVIRQIECVHYSRLYTDGITAQLFLNNMQLSYKFWFVPQMLSEINFKLLDNLSTSSRGN